MQTKVPACETNMVENIVPIEYATVDFNPFKGPEITALAPATESQMEIMTSCMIGGDAANRAFNESFSIRFHGTLNKSALENSLSDVVNRHDALRCAFSGDGKQICIFNNSSNPLDYQDISNFTNAKQEKILSDQTHYNAFNVFDLVNGPLFRVDLLKVSDNEHYLTITAHHIICDGWSLNVILQELGKLYTGYVQNTFVDLPAATPFSRYADEQQTYYGSEEYKRTENYWINQYKDNVPALNLATDFPRPALRTYKSKRIDFEVSADLLTDLKKVSYKSGCTLITTMIASFEVFLHRLTGLQAFAIGLPAAGQAATGNYNLVGHCVNLLPIQTFFDRKCSFQKYLKQRKKEILESLEQQRFSFGSLLKKLNIPRDASRIALVPVVFNVDMGMNDGVHFYGLKHELISNPREFETFELFLNISGSEKSSLTFEWSYNTRLFKPETIQKMMESFNSVLKTVAKDPLIEIKDIELTDTKKLAENLAECNDIGAMYEKDIPVHGLINKTAVNFPDKTALIFKEKNISYKTLNETANQLAHCLIQQGIKVGNIVGVALDRSPEMIISLLAVMKSGAAYLPIDPEFPEDRIRFMLKDSSAKMLISSAKFKGKFVPHIIELLIDDSLSILKNLSKKTPDLTTSGSDLAYIIYTSGTTGKPKGVLIEHHSLANLLLSMIKMPGINEKDILLAVTTVSFDIAALEMYLPLIAGATIILADAQTVKDGRELMQIAKEQHVSFMQATPSTYKMMLAAGWEQPLNLKILCCGEPMTKDLSNRLFVLCKDLFNMYGPTETTIYSTGKKIDINESIITIGKAINNTEIYILDENLSPVAKGITGEIFIAGAGVARGYVNQPELTAEKFIANTFSPHISEKMYRTGDLGKFLANGEIQCLGRTDRQIKVRGYRIEPGEIENEIRNHGHFKDMLVMACIDKKSNQRLTAFIVPETEVRDEQLPTIISKLKEGLKKELPAYMIPDNFINLNKLPLLLNGKIDFNALSDLCLHNKLLHDKTNLPFTQIEKLLISIWSEFLSLENIDVNDNFFELGGHSLIAVEVMMRIEKETGQILPLSTLFEYPTIKNLASLLQSDKKETLGKSLVPIKPSGNKAPVYIIHGSGLNVLNFSSIALYVDKDQPVYGLQAKGLNGADAPLNNMEDIAAYYISQVVGHNPKGPYAIAGYSFGGYVGIEMARQLKSMGKEVKMLAMFDTNAEEQNYNYGLLKKMTVKAARQFRKFFWISTSLVKRPKITVDYQLSYAKNKMKSIAAHFGLSAKEEVQGSLGEFMRISEQHDIAYNNYIIKPFDGVIDVFKAKKRIYFIDDLKFLGWKKYALKGVRIHDVPGDHKTMLLAPNDKEFAKALQNALDNC